MENVSNSSLVIEASNGHVIRQGKSYFFYSDQPGSTEISIYKLVRGKRHKIGQNGFIVKRVPNPIVRFGPRGDGDSIRKAELLNYEYLWAGLEYFDPEDIKYKVDSFTVYFFTNDLCKPSSRKNVSAKISEELKLQFSNLKANDVIVFREIFVKRLIDGATTMIRPTILFVKE